MVKYNKNLAGVQITDELIRRTSSASARLEHDTILASTVVVRTAAGGGGTLLTLTTDYTLGNADSRLTTEAGSTVNTTLAIVNGAYLNTNLYVSYKTVGDYAEAEDVNYVLQDMGLLPTGTNLNDKRTDMEKWRTSSSLTYANLPTGFSGDGSLIVYFNRQDSTTGISQEYTDINSKKATRFYTGGSWGSWVTHPSARQTSGSLDNEILPGFVRFETGSGIPSGGYGNCIVARRAGSDTIMQIATGFQLTEPLYWRSGNPTSIGGTGSWQAWRRLWDSVDTGGVIPASRKSIRGFGDGASVIGSTTKAIYSAGTSIVAPTWGGQIYWETDGNFTIGGQASGIAASGATIGTLTGTGNTGVYFERVS